MTDHQPRTIQFPVGSVDWYTESFPEVAIRTGVGSTVKALDKMTSTELVSLYNLIASNLGKGSVKRFADQRTGVRRTWLILGDYEATVKKEAEAFETPEAELAQQKGRPDRLSKPNTMAYAPLSDPNNLDAFNRATKAYEEQEAAKPAVTLTPADKAQVADEAASRRPAAKRGSQAGTIRAPRAPRADDGAIRLPTEGGKQRAKRQKDGSYAFRIPPTKPRTEKVSPEREELLGMLVGNSATWETIREELKKPNDFNTVTTITMFCITLGYGLLTHPDGTIELLEPLA